ncbi:NYN domain-containing protein [Nostoc sp. UHCC 0702]|nr:NYN domain-containing protein [Nostoc sp. UHCC 0702]
MTDIHLDSNEQTSQQQRKVAIYWDFQNVYLSQDLAISLLAFASLRGRLIRQTVYYNSHFKNQANAKDDLKRLGFKCEDVTCFLKDSADNQLKSDLIDDIYNNHSPHIIILVSGDGDFANPVKILQDKGKSVIIFAQKGNVKQKLKELANEFYFIDELPELVKKNNQPPTTSITSQINYNEAIEYLTEAINIALVQKKRTGLGYINKMMCQLFPHYQGFSAIHTSEGKKFKNFSQFVDAVVKDGKVRKQNQELFLIELDRLAA